jgi:hypothetical protein
MKTSCLNCTQSYEGRFCPECGQKAQTHRITFTSIAHDIPHSVFHVDKGFVYTFIQLLKDPGSSIRGFIEGKRIKHYAPFAYLFILSAATSLVAHFKGFYFETFLHRHLITSPNIPFLSASLFFNKYPALMFCLLIPVMSLCTYLFNMKSKYNYWENFVLNTYLVSQFNLFFILEEIICMLMGKASTSLVPMLAVFFFYSIWGYSRFFTKGGSISAIIKRVVMYICLVFIVITGISLAGFMTPWWGF